MSAFECTILTCSEVPYCDTVSIRASIHGMLIIFQAPFSKHILFHPHNHSMSYYHHPHFTDEEMETEGK